MEQIHAKLPTPSETEEARQAVRGLSEVLSKRSEKAIKVRASGDGLEASVSVPREAFQLFLEILGHMANGNTVTLMPIHGELTTQEAADLMNVSRPFLVGLLDEGKIPHRMVGTHRRIRAADLLAYLEKDKGRQQAFLDELAAEAQKHKLGY
jgi:excisionase family DNA binding protein